MYKVLSVLVAIAMAGVMMPTASAAESVSREYIGGGVRVLGYGLGVITCYEPGQGIDDLYPECEALRLLGYEGGVGGTDLITQGLYTNAIISASDDTFGSDVGMTPCFYNPDGDLTCDGDDYPGGRLCGTQALLGAPFASNFVSVFTYTVMVQDDLKVCGASAGVASADLF